MAIGLAKHVCNDQSDVVEIDTNATVFVHGKSDIIKSFYMVPRNWSSYPIPLSRADLQLEAGYGRYYTLISKSSTTYGFITDELDLSSINYVAFVTSRASGVYSYRWIRLIYGQTSSSYVDLSSVINRIYDISSISDKSHCRFGFGGYYDDNDGATMLIISGIFLFKDLPTTVITISG